MIRFSKNVIALLLGEVISLSALSLGAADIDGARDVRYWPQWRGPLMTGVSPSAHPPVHWGEDRNIKWKTPLPGLGHSTPVVWGDRIFLTTAAPVGKPLDKPIPDSAPGAHDNYEVASHFKFSVLAIDRADGHVIWQKDVREALPHEGGHYTGSHASHSPVTDGRHLFAYFGSYGLYCFDLNGELIWQKDLGLMHTKHGHGEGSSPVLADGILVVNWDQEDQSFIVAFEAGTGKQLWKTQRDERTSWATPIVVEVDGKNQLIVSGTKAVRCYDLKTGEVIWEASGLSDNVVASPVAGSGIVIAGSSYEKQAMLAVRLAGAKGDVSESSNLLWRRSRSTPYVPSPLLYGGDVYFLRHYQNVMSRVNIETGADEGGPFRLGELRNIYSSPVGADGRVYVTSREGLTIVITNSGEPKLLAVNHLDDTFSASIALVDNTLYLRGEKYLYAIEEANGSGGDVKREE